MLTIEQARDRLDAIGQAHVLAFYNELPPAQQSSLLAQLDALDLAAIPALIDEYVRRRPALHLPDRIDPAPFYPMDPADPARPWDRDRYAAVGEELIRAGKLAAFVVAGGQGTRLGFDGPKGCFPAGAVSGATLFEMFARQIAAAQHKFGVTIPWYIMTSPLNHDATVAYLRANDFFGLDPEAVSCFQQGVMPSFDAATGRLLLADRHALATNPDGHGGSLKALVVGGAIDDMKHRGIELISYFQVDNPSTKIVDPVFIGLHAAAPDSSAEMSSKMLAKRDPAEKVGVFCVVDGKLQMVEYSDLPGDLAAERLPAGQLRFSAGNPAIHLLSVEFVERLSADPAFALPFHRADKKVACIDPGSGGLIEPTAPNAVKLERFVFDALPLARRSLVLETDRIEEFAPVKNAEGDDSPASSRRLQTERAARWLEGAGVTIPRDARGHADCTLELLPATALLPEDLNSTNLPASIERGAHLVL